MLSCWPIFRMRCSTAKLRMTCLRSLRVQIRLQSRKFVALPETFPSELIGQTAPNFSLTAQDGKTDGRRVLTGKSPRCCGCRTTVLFGRFATRCAWRPVFRRTSFISDPFIRIRN